MVSGRAFFGESAIRADDAEAGSFFIVCFICDVLSLRVYESLRYCPIYDTRSGDGERISWTGYKIGNIWYEKRLDEILF